MVGRLLNLPLKVLSKAAKAYQTRVDGPSSGVDPGGIAPQAPQRAQEGPAPVGECPPAWRWTVAQLAGALASGAGGEGVEVVDVRASAGPTVPGAVWMPLSEVSLRVSELSTERPVVVVCEDGREATAAVAFFRERGMEDTFVLAGGLAAWRAAGRA